MHSTSLMVIAIHVSVLLAMQMQFLKDVLTLVTVIVLHVSACPDSSPQLIPNPAGCAEYFECTSGNITATYNCSDDKVFDPNTAQCMNVWQVPCSGR